MSADPRMQMTRTLNGISVDQLNATVTTLQQSDPKAAQFVFRARNHWIDGGYNQAMVRDFSAGGQEDVSRLDGWTFDVDEPPVLLGQNRGANPVEYVLVGLSGCLTTSLIVHAAARGIELEQVESRVEGNLDARGFIGLDPTVRNGYQQIRVTFRITAPDATPEQLEELVQVARDRSPVFDTVANPVPVQVSLER